MIPSSQLSLTTEFVDLTDEEKIQRGRDLADALRHLARLDEDHTNRKGEMRKARREVLQQIAGLAEIVRSGREERPIGVARG